MHSLIIPPGTPTGAYTLFFGGYRLSDGQPLGAAGSHIRDNLFIDPQPVTINP